jgi:hypothetical protein
MIPGAMVALALCLLLHRESGAALIAAFGAVGVGFGGQETYGQTVHISTLPGTWGLGMTGFTIKGAVWGLLGGACLGIAFTRQQHRTSRFLTGLLLMAAGTYAGWKLVNQPKRIYFSYLLDRPREELWAGLLLGGVLLLVGVSARLPWRFALWGTAGGGLGFGLGAAIHIWGRTHLPDFPFGWWKTMEFTFGALLGCSYGYCAWLHRNELSPNPPAETKQSNLYSAIPLAAAGILLAIVISERLPVRFDYTVAGAILLAAAWFSDRFSWQTAITVTYCAYAFDLLESRRDLPALPLWTFVILTTLLTAVYTAKFPRVRSLFLYLTVTSVAVALLKGLFLPPAELRIELITTELTFVVLGVATLLAAFRMSRPPAEPQTQPPRLSGSNN